MIVRLARACGVLAVMLARARGTCRFTWATGSNRAHDADRPAASWVHTADFHFAVKFVFDRLSVPFVILSFLLCGTIGGVRQQLPAPRAGLQPVLRALRPVRPGHGAHVAGRHDRDAVRRLGAGRPVVGAARGVLSGAAGAGRATACGSGSSIASPTRPCCWPPSCCTTCAAQGDFDALLGATPPWPDRPLRR